jgi:hypothetical protein
MMSKALIEVNRSIRLVVTPSHVWAVMSVSYRDYIQAKDVAIEGPNGEAALWKIEQSLTPILAGLGWERQKLLNVIKLLREFKKQDRQRAARVRCRLGQCTQDTRHEEHLRATEEALLQAQLPSWKLDIKQVSSTGRSSATCVYAIPL